MIRDMSFADFVEAIFEEPVSPHTKRMIEFYSGRSQEDLRIVVPLSRKTYQLIGARIETKPWSNHRANAKSGEVQVYAEGMYEIYPDDEGDE